MQGDRLKSRRRQKKLNMFFRAGTIFLLAVLLYTVMSAAARMETQRQIRARTRVVLDTSGTFHMNVGDSYVFRASVTPEDAVVTPVAGELVRCEEVFPETGQRKEGDHYFSITALAEGATTAGAEAGLDSASFSVAVTRRETMADRAQSCESATDYLVLTDLENQRVGIFTGSKGNWQQVKDYACSSGAAGMDTPKGEFTIQERGDWFFNYELDSGAKWWVRFDGPYLFHSLEMDIRKNVKDTRLGEPLSHGCVRLNIDEAKWLHDNVPAGSRVIVY